MRVKTGTLAHEQAEEYITIPEHGEAYARTTMADEVAGIRFNLSGHSLLRLTRQ